LRWTTVGSSDHRLMDDTGRLNCTARTYSERAGG
jgi:hypothetical protein